MRELRVGDEEVTLLDDADYEWAIQFEGWHVGDKGYVMRYEVNQRQTGVRTIKLHRELMKEALAERGGRLHVHHKDLDKLNNQRENLVLMKPGDHKKLHMIGVPPPRVSWTHGGKPNRRGKGR